MNPSAPLAARWHLERREMIRRVARMANAAYGLRRTNQARHRRFVRVDHDFRGPIISAGSMAGFTIDAAVAHSISTMAGKTGIGQLDAIPGVRRHLPSEVNLSMTELALSSTNEIGRNDGRPIHLRVDTARDGRSRGLRETGADARRGVRGKPERTHDEGRPQKKKARRGPLPDRGRTRWFCRLAEVCRALTRP